MHIKRERERKKRRGNKELHETFPAPSLYQTDSTGPFQGPHSHRTRGYPPPPHLGEMMSKDIPICISGIITVGDNRKHPLSLPVFSGNLPETTAQKYPHFPSKWKRACGPLMHSIGGQGSLPVEDEFYT